MTKVGSRAFVAVFVWAAGCALPDAHPAPVASPAAMPPQSQGPLVARVLPLVDAPLDLRPEMLGVPLGDDFEPLTGGAGSLFPYARVTYQALGNVSSERRVLRDRNELKASLHVWRIPIGASAGDTSSHSYAFYRAVQITGVSQLDDSTTPMVPSTDPDARYYAAQIFYGYSYVVWLEGDEKELDGAIGLSLGQYAVASVGGLKSHYKFTANMSGRGLAPNVADGGAGVDPLFSPSERVAANYHTDGAPVPILVEYKAIPSRDNPVRRLQVDFNGLQIAKTGVLGVWGRCGYWSMEARCTVNGTQSATGALLDRNKVCPGPTGVARPALIVTASDQDVVECSVSGHYSRERHEAALGPGTTGRVVVGQINPSLSGPMVIGSEADTAYAMTWSMTRLP